MTLFRSTQLTRYHVERGLWIVAIICIAITGTLVVRAHQVMHIIAPTLPHAARNIMMYNSDTLERATDTIIANDPFRLTRQPSHVPFGMPAPPTPPPSSSHQRPALALGGIVGGPPWRAVLNGIPGHSGSTVISTGDTLGGLHIRSVRRDTVVVQGEDTTWIFTLRQ